MSRRSFVRGSSVSDVCLHRVCVFAAAAFAILGVATITSAADDKPDGAAAKPLASEEMDNGAAVDVLKVHRTSDGFVCIEFRYRNPGDKDVSLFSSQTAHDWPAKLYVIDEAAKKKGGVARVRPVKGKGQDKGDEQYLAAKIPYTNLNPGAQQLYWAKFGVPDETKKLTVVVPGAPPMENIPIAAEDAGAKPAAAAAAPAAPAAPAAGSEGTTAGTTAGTGDATGAKPPMATQTNNTGANVEVTRCRRTSDGFVELRWRYTLPEGKEQINLFSSQTAHDLPRTMYLLDPSDNKLYAVVTDSSGEPVASKLGYTNLEPGKSTNAWARFPVPEAAKTISVYLPDTLPIEDLPIEAGGTK